MSNMYRQEQTRAAYIPPADRWTKLWNSLTPRGKLVAYSLGAGVLAGAAVLGAATAGGPARAPVIPTGHSNFAIVGRPFKTTQFNEQVITETITGATYIGYATPVAQDGIPGDGIPGEVQMLDGALVEPNTPAGQTTVVPQFGPNQVLSNDSLRLGAETVSLGNGNNSYGLVLSASEQAGKFVISATFGPDRLLNPPQYSPNTSGN